MTDKSITPEQAREDIERMFDSAGEGSTQDRASQQLLQMLQILLERLDETPILKMIYLTDGKSESMLPASVYQIVDQLVRGEVTIDFARTYLQGAIEEYRKVFADLGINPSKPTALFFD